MPPVTDQAFTDFVRETFTAFGKDPTLYENNCPVYNGIKDNTETLEFTLKGYRWPMFATRPGGHTNVVPSNSSFNVSVPPTSFSQYCFPTYYYLPMIWQYAAILMAKRSKENLTNFGKTLSQWYDAALKRQEYYSIADGTATLAVSATTLNTPGPNLSLTGTTTAATTPNQTKGVTRLDRGSSFDSINPSTGAVRGNITVTTPGRTSCTVTLNYGTVASGDYLVDTGAYQKVPRGLGFLDSHDSRTLQGVPTSLYDELNSPVSDLNGSLLTPAAIRDNRSALMMRQNDSVTMSQFISVTTPTQFNSLASQGYSLTRQSTDKTMAYATQFSDGSRWILSSDMDEDRVYQFMGTAIRRFVEIELQVLDFDGQEWRMLWGNNGTGSADFQRALAMHWNMALVELKKSSYIKRALILQPTQVGSY